MEERRSNILIDPEIQLRLVGLIFGAGLSVLIVFGGYYWLHLRYFSALMSQAPINSSHVYGTLQFYGIISSIAALLILTIISFITLLVANRIVGPLYRIRRELEEMRKSGEIHMISIRERDYIENFVRSLNRLLLDVKRDESFFHKTSEIKEIKSEEEGSEETEADPEKN